MKYLLVLLAFTFVGCAIDYTTADKNRAVKINFNPSVEDYKAIRELTR